MSKTPAPVSFLPYASKDDFLATGLCETFLDNPLDCSICREPLAIADTIVGPCIATSQPPQVERAALRTASPGLTLDIDASFANRPPELPAQISPCNHIFGSTCLRAWFDRSTSSRCPECNITLFPARTIHLALRQPTRAMRIEFAHVVEEHLEDSTTAALIRQELMSEWTKVLMRELAIEIHRAQGYEVTWEYVGPDVGEEEEEEEARKFKEEVAEDGQDDGMESGSEYGPDEQDEDEDDDWWRIKTLSRL